MLDKIYSSHPISLIINIKLKHASIIDEKNQLVCSALMKTLYFSFGCGTFGPPCSLADTELNMDILLKKLLCLINEQVIWAFEDDR
jgi:hypothetical protein